MEGLKRKKRRIRLKALNCNEGAIEKFIAQSSKSAKCAKTVVKKRDTSASASRSGAQRGDTSDAGLGQTTANIQAPGSASQANK